MVYSSLSGGGHMEMRLIITLILLAVSLSSFADTCPRIIDINIHQPPKGWSMLIPPVIEGQSYYFDRAIHSLNGSFYYGQVICEYRSCGSFACPAFELLSDAVYINPEAKTPPWDDWPVIAQTLVCAPKDNDPAHCIFEDLRLMKN
jgi:hypothetical protein